MRRHCVLGFLLLLVNSPSPASVVVHLPAGQEGVVATDRDVVLDSYGHVWDVRSDAWHRLPEYDVPRPVASLRFWTQNWIVTTDNEALTWLSGQWLSRGFWPEAASVEHPLDTASGSVSVTPNPADSTVWIGFLLPTTVTVSVQIVDAAGRLIQTLLHGAVPPGPYALAWDGKDSHGRRSPNGTYFARVLADGRTDSARIVLAR